MKPFASSAIAAMKTNDLALSLVVAAVTVPA
jgi:hypothetical protein